MEYALVDTGVWYAVFDSRDQNHSEGCGIADVLEILNVVVPWPTLYETLRSRFVKNTPALQGFERMLVLPNVVRLDDSPYRDEALDLMFESSTKRRPLSLVDCLIRLVLDDGSVNIRYLAKFNRGDFRDVCHRRSIEMI